MATAAVRTVVEIDSVDLEVETITQARDTTGTKASFSVAEKATLLHTAAAATELQQQVHLLQEEVARLRNNTKEYVGEEPRIYHIFLRADLEAELERSALFREKNEEVLKLAVEEKDWQLNNPKLAVISMGSSSTQVYSSNGFVMSFPVGTKVSKEEKVQDLVSKIQEQDFKKLLFTNSIGYLCSGKVGDEAKAQGAVVELAALMEEGYTCPKGKETPDGVRGIYNRLTTMENPPSMKVMNRNKDATGMQFPQLQNDFAQALVQDKELFAMVFQTCDKPLAEGDAFVDWGGGSYKVYTVDGNRQETENLDANQDLVHQEEDKKLLVDKWQKVLKTRIQDNIMASVKKAVPKAKQIFIAQTGEAREVFFEGEKASACTQYAPKK